MFSVCQMLTTSLNSEAILTFENHDLFIAYAFYRPTSRYHRSLKLFKTIAENHPNLPIWITHDLNLPKRLTTSMA